MIARWSDLHRSGMAGSLSTLLHFSLFMMALQLTQPIRYVSVPVEIEIIRRSPPQEPPQPSRPEPSPVRTRPPKPVIKPKPAPPPITIPEPAPEEELAPVEEPTPTEAMVPLPVPLREEAVAPALPVAPFVPEAPAMKEPVYMPLVQVTQMPAFKTKMEPFYPELARRLEKEGTVILELNISEEGEVLKVEVVKGVGFGFDEAARDAIERSSFEPARVGDRPVAVVVRIPIRFRFKD